jgi:hypothetical protein
VPAALEVEDSEAIAELYDVQHNERLRAWFDRLACALILSARRKADS